MKKVIRLSESQLNRVIKESVKRCLNEVRVGDEDLHGNNPNDWQKMASHRYWEGIYPIERERENDMRDGYADFMRRMEAGQLSPKELEDYQHGEFHTPNEDRIEKAHYRGLKHFIRDYNNFAKPNGYKTIDREREWWYPVENQTPEYSMYHEPKRPYNPETDGPEYDD